MTAYSMINGFARFTLPKALNEIERSECSESKGEECYLASLY